VSFSQPLVVVAEEETRGKKDEREEHSSHTCRCSILSMTYHESVSTSCPRFPVDPLRT
jgi:hypothetical protein